jgi:asparagine synthetase B (glutamine-hydrolysing)
MFGMESRIPFLTQSFAKYVLSIMGRVKFRQTKEYAKGTNKFLMREVMKDYLPEHVRLRKKKIGWSSPWDNNHPELSPKWRIQDLHFLKQLSR